MGFKWVSRGFCKKMKNNFSDVSKLFQVCVKDISKVDNGGLVGVEGV